MKTLRNGKWNTDIATAAEVAEAVAELEAVIEKYGWQNRTIRIYSFSDKLMSLIERWKEFSSYTFSSKQILISEINRTVEILTGWVKTAEEPKVKVLSGGRVMVLPQSVAEIAINCGAAELIA